MLNGNPYDANCTTRRILDRIGGRWTVLMVGALGDGDARFSELRRRTKGYLAEDADPNPPRGGARWSRGPHCFPEVPAGVEYSVTEAGRTLLEPLSALRKWSIEHLGDISASQDAYDHVD